jgi:hypothetical protein
MVMSRETNGRPRPTAALRAAIEIAFIVFLFYSNLLMGEFTRGHGMGKTLRAAVIDIFTPASLTIALVSAGIGYLVFEYLRKRL